MLKSIFVISMLFAVSIHGFAAEPGIFEVRGLQGEELTALNGFLGEIDRILPEKVRQKVTTVLPERINQFAGPSKKVIVELTSFTNDIQIPSCDMVDTMEEAERLRRDYDQIVAINKFAKGIRYEGQVHSMVVADKNSTPHGLKIVINRAFLPIIMGGESKAATYNCGHRNLYRLAQAAVLNGVARILDATKYEDNIEKAANSSKGICNPNTKVERRVVGHVDCEDMKGASTLISERARYRNITFGWEKDNFFGRSFQRSAMAYWPRAVNRYEYAGNAADHFAFNFEFYLLDSDFQCRKPLLHAYLSERLSHTNTPFQPKFAKPSDCKVNSKIYLNVVYRQDDGSLYVNPGEEDMNPDRVAEISYYRASVGAAAMSLFGHAMYRVVICSPGSIANEQGECDRLSPYDLIINPRANPRQMRMDQVRGIFGGYPSQFLISRFDDIWAEYGQGELRHLFNFPLGKTGPDKRFVPMSKAERRDFVYGALESYWSYVGDYKFMSNNCADETMRLYRMVSKDSRFANANILTPKGVSKFMAERGVIDSERFNRIREPGLLARVPFLGKLFWDAKDKEEQREEIENNEHVDQSFLFLTHDSIADIYRRENGKEADVDTIEKEMKKWAKIAEISDKASTLCKNHEKYPTEVARLKRVDEQITEIMERYLKLYEDAKKRHAAGDPSAFKDMTEINRSFHAIIAYTVEKRRKDLSDLVVELGYEMAKPAKGQKLLCGKNGWTITPETRARIEALLKEYEEAEENIQPYSTYNLRPGGYGIPLISEMKQTGGETKRILENEIIRHRKAVMDLVEVVGPQIGMDYQLYVKLEALMQTLRNDRRIDGLPTYK